MRYRYTTESHQLEFRSEIMGAANQTNKIMGDGTYNYMGLNVVHGRLLIMFIDTEEKIKQIKSTMFIAIAAPARGLGNNNACTMDTMLRPVKCKSLGRNRLMHTSMPIWHHENFGWGTTSTCVGTHKRWEGLMKYMVKNMFTWNTTDCYTTSHWIAWVLQYLSRGGNIEPNITLTGAEEEWESQIIT